MCGAFLGIEGIGGMANPVGGPCNLTARRSRRRRPAILPISAPIMLGLSLLGFVVMMLLMTGMINIMMGSMVDVITTVPTIHAYDDNGNRFRQSDITPEMQTLLDERDAIRNGLERESAYGSWLTDDARLNQIKNELRDLGYQDMDATIVSMYWAFATPAAILLILILLFCAIGWFWEDMGLWNRGTMAETAKWAIISLIVIPIVPEIWDIYAIGMTELARDSIHPEDPNIVLNDLWCQMGGLSQCMADPAKWLQIDTWFGGDFWSSDWAQTILDRTIMPFFKLSAAFTMTVGLFVVGIARIMLIIVVLSLLPIVLVLRLLPFFDGHAKSMVSALIACTLSPILVGFTLQAGWHYLNMVYIDPLEQWITVLCIIGLASSWPVAMASLLGNAVGSVEGAVQDSMKNSSMMATSMGIGMAAGAGQGFQSVGGGGAGLGQGLTGALTGMAMGGGQSMVGHLPGEFGGGGLASAVEDGGVFKVADMGARHDLLGSAGGGGSGGTGAGDMFGGAPSGGKGAAGVF